MGINQSIFDIFDILYPVDEPRNLQRDIWLQLGVPSDNLKEWRKKPGFKSPKFLAIVLNDSTFCDSKSVLLESYYESTFLNSKSSCLKSFSKNLPIQNTSCKCILIKKEELRYSVDIVEFMKKYQEIDSFESEKKIFSRTLHRLTCHGIDRRLQMLSPMFSKLNLRAVDLMSPTPEKLNHRSIKYTVPLGQDQQLLQIPSSLMFAVLGWSGDSPTATIEAFDTMKQKWFYIPQGGFLKRAYHGVVLMGILLYVIGGYDGRRCYDTCYCFHLEKRQWYRRPPMLVARCYVTVLVYRGMVYALGGFDGDERFKSCERFDPKTRRWTYFAYMNDRRSDASGTVHKGKIYVCGGFNGVQVLASTEIYDPEQNQWSIIAHMQGPRSGHALVSYKGTLVVVGGYDGQYRLRTVEQYEESENMWFEYVPMWSPRSNFAAVVLGNQLYVLGGYDGETTFGEVERFDDVREEWQQIASLRKHRSAHGACVSNDSMVVSMCTEPGHVTLMAANVEQPSP